MYGYFGYENLHIVHQNIRSLRKNFHALIDSLNCLPFQPDLIFLTETWIYPTELYKFKIAGYRMFTNCNTNRKSGGVAVYIRAPLFKNCEVTRFHMSSCDMLRVECNINDQTYVFLCVYRLHNNNLFSKNIFLNQLDDYIDREYGENLIILGDMNIDLLLRSSIVRNYLNLMSNNSLETYITEPTRITRKRESCIDHIFARFGELTVSGASGEVRNFGITDHCMTSLSLELITF